ncbi:MAG: phosphatidylserine/phosphatidylglycerophosphate/cardiolipin synthase family protein [Ruminococcus sp.]|nr:phosphatidylserine/phosphatidylglycerophosphate/cardiolipin synthase family protein [Ruminococcus sp.]
MRIKSRILASLLCIMTVLCSCSDNDGSSLSSGDDISSYNKAQSSQIDQSSFQESSQPDDTIKQESTDIKQRFGDIISDTSSALVQDSSFTIDESTVGKDIAQMYDYINKTGCFPVYKGVDIEYYPMGELALEPMLDELRAAKKFIFLEYYTLNEGQMWDAIYEILKEKAADGVEVMVMYDLLINSPYLPSDFQQQLESDGIKCIPFSGADEGKSSDTNLRDHRKIMVIDGKTAFTGGVNIADSYINITHEYGVWKDNVIKIKGSAAGSFTLMVMQLWNASGGDLEYEKYLNVDSKTDDNGYIMPFSDSPYDKYLVGKSFYLTMLENASDYIYITTPYLIPDKEFEDAMISTAARGVDVKVYVPGTSDLAVAGMMTRSHYKSLIDGGVKIFEYKKGFIHSKVFVSDDVKAIVGTVNIDNRSFLYDFECGVYIYGKEAISDILAEFTDNENDFREITSEEAAKYSNVSGYLFKGIEGYF